MKNPTSIGGVQVLGGPAALRATCHTEFPDAPIGSLYLGEGAVSSTKPNAFIKISDTAWARVVTQASD